MRRLRCLSSALVPNRVPTPRSDLLPKLLLALSSALLWALPTPAGATGVTWMCGLSESLTELVCLADPDPAEPEVQARTAVVRGTEFPLDPRRRFTVQLWSPPTELDRLELLARATICYRSPSCEVVMLMSGELAAALGPRRFALQRR